MSVLRQYSPRNPVSTLLMVGELEGDPDCCHNSPIVVEVFRRRNTSRQTVVLANQKHNYFASAPEEIRHVIRGFLPRVEAYILPESF